MQLRSHRLVLVLSSAFLASALIFGCGGGDDEQASENADSSLASPAASSQSGSNDSPSTGAGGTAFTRTSMLELAGQTAVEGYEAQEPVEGAGGANVTVTHQPVEGGSGLFAIVTLSPCDPFLCWDLDGEITAEHEANLKSLMASVHIDNPDLVFEYGTIEASPGYEAFYVYNRSFVIDGTSKSASNNYRLIYHDGSNLISVQIAPEFGPLPASEEELEMQMDQAKGEMAARNFFAAYAEAFQPVE